MRVNDMIREGEVLDVRTSVIPPSRYIEHPMFWAELSHGLEALSLGTREPAALSAALRQLADRLDATAADYAALEAARACGSEAAA